MIKGASAILTSAVLIFGLVMYPSFANVEAASMEGMGAKVQSGTIESMQDPGIGHESHQLAIILPPSDQVYSGALTYSASEPVQLVALHGPLAEGEDMGQPIWTPDGETKFGLTFVDKETDMGTWKFSGNALAVHTMNPDPFSVSYSVKYWKTEMSDTTTSDTIESMQDPGIGHESHQLAIILPPSEDVYSGMLSYAASEPIQLVALHGPLAEGEDMGQPIWTPDGETKFGLTFVDKETDMGSWMFSGNALAVHTMNTDPFTVSYSVSNLPPEVFDIVESGTMQSEQDPGIGHESHQLAIVLPPSEDVYSGMLSYAASEPIQLVALHGPLAEGEDMGQPIWTPDGETKFGLTFVDKETDMGTWMFSGNALAVHTMNMDPFTVSYSVNAEQIPIAMMDDKMTDDKMMDDKMTDDKMMDDKMTDDKMMDDKMTDDKMMDDKMTDDKMMDDKMMEEEVMSPLEQMRSGVEPSDVECKEGYELIFKSSDGSAACVSPSTASTLIQRGWATQ